jgi:hypothetical protein
MVEKEPGGKKHKEWVNNVISTGKTAVSPAAILFERLVPKKLAETKLGKRIEGRLHFVYHRALWTRKGIMEIDSVKKRGEHRVVKYKKDR